jgi:hypothetical protein
MTHFILDHPIASLALAFIIALIVAVLVALFTLKEYALRGEPPMIAPRELSDTHVTASVAVELGSVGFTVKEWKGVMTESGAVDCPHLQITDSEGISFYMPKDASLGQCIQRYHEKQDEFYGTKRFAKSVHA